MQTPPLRPSPEMGGDWLRQEEKAKTREGRNEVDILHSHSHHIFCSLYTS